MFRPLPRRRRKDSNKRASDEPGAVQYVDCAHSFAGFIMMAQASSALAGRSDMSRPNRPFVVRCLYCRTPRQHTMCERQGCHLAREYWPSHILLFTSRIESSHCRSAPNVMDARLKRESGAAVEEAGLALAWAEGRTQAEGARVGRAIALPLSSHQLTYGWLSRRPAT